METLNRRSLPYLGRYVGNGAKNRYSFREVFFRNGKPYLSFQPQPNKHVFDLLPTENQHYRFKVEEPDVYVESWFVPSKAGDPDQFFEKFKNDTLRYTRTLTYSVSRATLTQYAGRYTSQELDSQLNVKVDRNGLSLQRGIIKIKAIPIGEDRFYAPDERALFYFKRNEAGSVIEFSISASDFRHVKFSR